MQQGEFCLMDSLSFSFSLFFSFAYLSYLLVRSLSFSPSFFFFIFIFRSFRIYLRLSLTRAYSVHREPAFCSFLLALEFFGMIRTRQKDESPVHIM